MFVIEPVISRGSTGQKSSATARIACRTGDRTRGALAKYTNNASNAALRAAARVTKAEYCSVGRCTPTLANVRGTTCV